jgi:spermidine/putrescine transport system ATP-binding protein
MDTAADVELLGVRKSFRDVIAVDKVSLRVEPGEFFSLLGPSGCGKTTTLRMIAGFEHPTDGDVRIQGRIMGGTPPFARNVNTVFQNYALFPHMNVAENVAFGLRMKGRRRSEIIGRVTDVLALVRLTGYENRRPRELSGGQQQRVALARALINHPAVLLLDEPLGALDLKLRKEMQGELKRLQKSVGITFIYVTHDQEEALTMSDRIAVMSRGRVVQVGSPQEIYERPDNRFVADFIGETNFLDGTLRAIGPDRAIVELDGGRTVAAMPAIGTTAPGEQVTVAIRPENLRLTRSERLTDEAEPPGGLHGRIEEIVYRGSDTDILVRVGDQSLIRVRRPRGDAGSPGGPFEFGSEVAVDWDVGAARLLRS